MSDQDSFSIEHGDKRKLLHQIFSIISNPYFTEQQRRNFFKTLSIDQTKYIVEIVTNLGAGKIPVANLHKRSLLRYSRIYRKLSHNRTSYKQKTKLIRIHWKAVLLLLKITQNRLPRLMMHND